MFMIEKSDRVAQVHSDIRGPLYLEALRMQSQGIPVLKLITGTPGSCDFTLPESVRRALADHVDEAVPYCDVRGMLPARQAILDYHRGRGLKGIELDDIFDTIHNNFYGTMANQASVGTTLYFTPAE